MFRRFRKYTGIRDVLLPVLLLAELLCSCAAPPEEIPPPGQSGAAMRSEQLEESARPLSEEEILTAYYRAVMVYGWFDQSPLPNDGHTVAAENGANYRRVNRTGVETLEDLRTCLRSVFSQEVTERLLETGGEIPWYLDIDGVLYVCGESRSPDASKGHTEVEILQTGETAYAVNVTVDLLDEDGESVTGLECWSFPYAFVEDRWVFTDFRLVN